MPAVAFAGPLRFPIAIALTLGSSLLMWTLLGPRMWHTMFKIQLALAILRMLTAGW
jgi:hypothetical protein